MAGKNRIIECDVCGFEYKQNIMKKNSYGMYVCPQDYEGSYDLKNNPQQKNPKLAENFFIKNARPDPNIDRNLDWQTSETKWEQLYKYWNLV